MVHSHWHQCLEKYNRIHFLSPKWDSEYIYADGSVLVSGSFHFNRLPDGLGGHCWSFAHLSLAETVAEVLKENSEDRRPAKTSVKVSTCIYDLSRTIVSWKQCNHPSRSKHFCPPSTEENERSRCLEKIIVV